MAWCEHAKVQLGHSSLTSALQRWTQLEKGDDDEAWARPAELGVMAQRPWEEQLNESIGDKC